MGVDCTTCREALSARLDGEDEPAPPAEADAHLTRCPPCAAWHTRAEALTRRMRVREAVETPDLTGAVLAAHPPREQAAWAHAALVVVAVLQMGVAMSQVLGATGHAATGHLFNEGIAWNAAVAIGLFAAAVRPNHARGLLTTLTAFVAVLAAYSLYDLVTAAASPIRVLSHLPLVAAVVLLHLVSRTDRPSPHPADRGSTDQRHDTASPHPDAPNQPRRGDGSGPLRPTARQDAA